MNKPRFGSWIEQYDPQTLPVQVCGVRDGEITEDGRGVECFSNIRDARVLYPDLQTPDQTAKTATRFNGPMRGILQDSPAMRYESVEAYRMYSA
jgi:hypothetical protein